MSTHFTTPQTQCLRYSPLYIYLKTFLKYQPLTFSTDMTPSEAFLKHVCLILFRQVALIHLRFVQLAAQKLSLDISPSNISLSDMSPPTLSRHVSLRHIPQVLPSDILLRRNLLRLSLETCSQTFPSDMFPYIISSDTFYSDSFLSHGPLILCRHIFPLDPLLRHIFLRHIHLILLRHVLFRHSP